MYRSSRVLSFILLLCVNLVYFSTYVLKLPPLLLLTNLLTFCICIGGLVQVVHGKTSGDPSTLLDTYVSMSTLEKYAKPVLESLNVALNELKLITLWSDPLKSLYTLLILYGVGFVVKVIPSSLLFFLFTWALFIYVCMQDFFHKRIYCVIKPYVNKSRDFLYGLYYSIPKLGDVRAL